MQLDLRKPGFYAHLELPILIIKSKLEKENQCLHEISHNSIAIYNLSIHQLLSG